jgi:hypothetical protein
MIFRVTQFLAEGVVIEDQSPGLDVRAEVSYSDLPSVPGPASSRSWSVGTLSGSTVSSALSAISGSRGILTPHVLVRWVSGFTCPDRDQRYSGA